VIVSTVLSVLESDYPSFRVIVINDGSTDGTSDELKTHFGHNPRVEVIDQAKLGKTRALNRGIELVTEEGFVTLDADTEIAPNCLRIFAAHLSNKKIGAIAGNAKVGNRINLLTWLQAGEYVFGWNWERRALDAIGCLTIVPGAIGCWRTEAIRRIDGFTDTTNAEDTDQTLMLHRLGYHVSYEARAVAYTEAPLSISMLLNQRTRWTIGILQALWKHKRSLGNTGLLGWIGIPNLLIYQVVLPLLDLAITPLIIGAIICCLKGQEPHAGRIGFISSCALFFLFVELGSSLLAIGYEDREHLLLVASALAQRIIYRPIIALALLRAFSDILRRKDFEWNKMDRSATLKRQPPARK
jgi:cellulose synthase/poly-beta-1,6-N-acetylglucosamine synthase-like glycosyltransferase